MISQRLRRQLASANWLVTIVMLGVLFILVNFISSRRYVRSDVSRTKITQLSPKTTQALRQLKDPVNFYIFYDPSHKLYEMIKDLLAEYRETSDKISVEYVDPQQDLARAKQLVQQFQIDVERDEPNMVIVQAGKKHQFVGGTDLAEYDFSGMGMGGEPTLKAFKGEDAFTSAILSVTQQKQPIVWISTGHNEKSVDDAEPLGLASLKKYLERENMLVEAVTLLEKTEIPRTVNAVVIAGPERRYTEQELLVLEAYLEQGGRLLALIDPLTDTGLDGLLYRWGADLGMDIVVDPARRLPYVSPANVFITTYTNHPIVQHMETLMTLFPLARSARPVPDRPGVEAAALAMTSESGWGETQVDVQPFRYDANSDTQGPVPIAVAAHREGDASTRVVVIGDSDFVANGQLMNVGNRDLALGAFHWLVGQEQLIGIGPKPLESIKLSLTAAQMAVIFWFCLATLPGTFALLGVAMWLLRRS